MSNRVVQWVFWPTAVALVLGTTFFLWYRSLPRRNTAPASAAGKKDPQTTPGEDDDDWTSPSTTTTVQTVHPRSGAMERITVQMGTVETDEVPVFAQVTGRLKSLVQLKRQKKELNIGDRFKENELLAVIDVPELEEQVKRNEAGKEQAEARVQQMTARLAVAKSDLEAEKAQIVYAEANARAATAWLNFRTLELERIRGLAEDKAVEFKIVDEVKQKYEAARESEGSAKAAIVASKAKVESATSKILLANADLTEARSQVKIAEAELAKSQELLKFAHIRAPFEGIITHRGQVPGSMVRSVSLGGNHAPLLTIQRTDRMRVIVQIPDDDVPYADPGDKARVEINALPGVKPIEGKISRIAKAEDPRTRLMQIEIDLIDPDPRIRQGMYGKVSITLDSATDQLSIPSACLAGKAKTREATIFLERDGKAKRARVKLGPDNGSRVVVLDPAKDETHYAKLSKTDRVIVSPRGLSDGTEVQATLDPEAPPKEHNQP